MRITLTRESVSMGDDAHAPHFADLEVPDDATLSEVLRALDETGYHHVNAGGWTTWTAHLGAAFRGGPSRSVAVLRRHYAAYLEDPLARVTELAGDGPADLQFEYRLGDDPDTLRDRLLQGRRRHPAEDFGAGAEFTEE